MSFEGKGNPLETRESKKRLAQDIQNSINIFNEIYLASILLKMHENPEDWESKIEDWESKSRSLQLEQETLELFEGSTLSEFVKGASSVNEVLVRANLRIFELCHGRGLSKDLSKDQLEEIRAYAVKTERYEILSQLDKALESGEKPAILYHGSTGAYIGEFYPRSSPERPDEDAAVYASPNFEVAVQSMANQFVSNGGFLNQRKFVCIPMEREDFIRHDQGGTVYEFSSDSFRLNDGKGLAKDEYVSKQSVSPLGKKRFPSLLEALLEQGTEVYFIKPEMIDVIKKAQNDGSTEELEKILNGLESENHRINK